VKLNIPGGVLQKDLSEPADDAQRMVLFYRSLYDAVKQLLRFARFAGRQQGPPRARLWRNRFVRTETPTH
jgi:hypothetical protein